MISQKLLELEKELEMEKKALEKNLSRVKENVQLFSDILEYQWR